ncbi:Methylthioribulose-1-phosphate dehydratase [Wallemia mellicola]|uniref:Methylthioribulose-1-phosphate dehydratase n=1 Tax=Wallemia mellicola TaxID=1708541 RepID=A0AB38N1F7_9BASI|nr:Methylthioribulose-1-phosphate dehydratase [Wallemia mellicola]TIC37323.1 Methylthioribulose-1-phosphate dehydratase [Wallemia mellicola]TIC43436.1 Methylthioribulose-1-phosphate dehydratase [Wallemia mellicola]TIC45892.1 Methylthioribulose-1-phosphate dehydratase [Wallemia mellicola]TIC52432.1 Methylthioribulose-1-phosphate dehydratase [Wallemia mellicola]
MCSADELVKSTDPLHPANLIPELCENMYRQGWVTGTGGGISIRDELKAYIAPSGVQKERIKPEDMFVLTVKDRKIIRAPGRGLKESACTPLFFNAFNIRGALSCIHTHSQNCVMATLLWGKEFRISHQEMIKGVRKAGMTDALTYLDTLVLPIIENTPNEEDLMEGMAEAMRKYPDAPGVLVRRHGIYVWVERTKTLGPTWEKAKAQTECIDYLCELGVKITEQSTYLLYKMRLAGMRTVPDEGEVIVP